MTGKVTDRGKQLLKFPRENASDKMSRKVFLKVNIKTGKVEIDRIKEVLEVS